MEFKNLKNLVKKENDAKIKKAIEEGEDLNENVLRFYLTEGKWNKYKNNELSAEQTQAELKKRIEKYYSKILTQKLKKIEEVEKAEDIDNITVSIEWVRNRTWGWNPTAYVFTCYVGETTGAASGCGYDKESAAIAEAFNKNNCILKILYELKEKALQENENISSHDACGYGAGYGAMPYFEGGVGVSCFVNILKKAGFSCMQIRGGKISDSYNFVKRGAEKNV